MKPHPHRAEAEVKIRPDDTARGSDLLGALPLIVLGQTSLDNYFAEEDGIRFFLRSRRTAIEMLAFSLTT